MKLRKCLENIKPYIPGKLKPGAIKLASNENPLGPSPKAIETLKENAVLLSQYPDYKLNDLAQDIADRCKLKRSQIILGNGTDEVLLFIAGAYINEGDEAVTAECTFSEYTFAATLFGGNMKYAPMKAETYDLEAIAKLIKPKTKVIFLSNPNNPTGTYFKESSFNEFMQKVPSEVLVVVDEAYVEYINAKDFPNSLALLAAYKNIIILRTFSKIYGLAGLRVGYGLANEQIINDLSKTKEPFNVNLAALIAARAALTDTDFVKKSIELNENGKKFYYRELKKLKLSFYETQANFIFIDLKKDALSVFQQMMEKGVTVRPLNSFGRPTCIRVTIGTAEQNEKVISLLKENLSR